MARLMLLLAACSGAVAVALGAFGAHGLKRRLGTDMLAVWETAVQYHLLHTLALFGVGLWLLQRPGSGAATGGLLFAVGTLLFSGSLYMLALGGPRWLGPVTPLGGVCLIAGWLVLAWSAWRI